jgi:hypothetical protein
LTRSGVVTPFHRTFDAAAYECALIERWGRMSPGERRAAFTGVSFRDRTILVGAYGYAVASGGGA